MSNYDVINIISPLKPREITEPELICFQVEYKAYNERVSNVNETHPSNQWIWALSILQCIMQS